MHRLVLVAVGSLLSCGAAVAQGLDASRIHPITTPIRDAGTLDLGNGYWRDTTGRTRASTKVFDNTCQWTGGGFFYHSEHCEDVYDEGRIPCTSDPSAPAGATDDNWIDSFQIAYCTGHPTAQIEIAVAFWNHNGGDCVGGLAQRAILPPGYNGASAYFDLTGLPGYLGGASLTCWIITIDLANTPKGGFCLLSDGDGQWDGTEQDKFTWAFQHEMDSSVYGSPSGPIISGDPSVAPFGACSYDIPCGTDTPGFPCGTGLDTADSFWLNTDGTPVGGPVNTALCPGGYNTGCYSFGGWPANTWASFWLELTSDGICRGHCPALPVVYCTFDDPGSGTFCGFAQCRSSNGCTARITTSAMHRCPERNGDDYDLIVEGTESQKWGILFGTTAGRASVAPFSSGTLCCQAPIVRTPPQLTGTLGWQCSGSLRLRINDPASASPILNQPPGTIINYQGWTRDPASPYGTDLSDAIEIVFH